MNASGSTQLVFRRGGPDDFDELIALNRAVYGEEFFTNRAYFDWQYARGPDGPAMVYLACAGDRVVGAYLLILQTLSVFGRDCLTGHSVGTVVHAEYRRHLTRDGGRLRTIFARLGDMACEACEREGIALTYAFPNEQSHPTFVKLLGFTDLGPLRVFARPVRPGSFIAQRIPGPRPVARLVGQLANAFVRLGLRRKGAKPPAGVEIERVSVADERFDRLWASCQPLEGIARKRDRAYVQWRFFDHPVFDYDVWMAMQAGRPIAYVAAMAAEQKDRARGTVHRLGHIVDFLAAPTEDVAPALVATIGRACEELQGKGIEFIIAGHVGREAEQRALRRAGLFMFPRKRSPRHWPCTVRVHRTDLVAEDSGVLALDNWTLHLSDNDTV